MAFINAIVNTPEDTGLRVNIRCEFLALGVADILERLHARNIVELQQQLEVFEEQSRIDFLELGSEPDLSRVDLSQIDSVYYAIKSTATADDGMQLINMAFNQLLLMSMGTPVLR